MPAPRQHWSTGEVARLAEAWPTYTFATRDAFMAQFPGRTWRSLKAKACELGLLGDKTANGETQEKVLSALRERGPLTIVQLECRLNLTNAAVVQAIRRLAERRRVEVVGQAPPHPVSKRRAYLWACCEEIPEAQTASMMDKLRANRGNPFAQLLPSDS